jgi:predicted transposase/invertase (TIGR01784 family)
MAIIKNRLDRGQAEYNAREKGHAEGHAEKALEIAQKMKKMGLPVAQIAEGTGLSPEAIQKL